jgi:hypothetical protein
MTNGGSGPAGQPAARPAAQPQTPPVQPQPQAPAQLQPYDVIRTLLRAGRNDEAIVRASSIAIARPDDLVAKELLFDAFFQKRDWAPALALAEELARRAPQVARLEKALVATLSNMSVTIRRSRRPFNTSSATARISPFSMH